MVVKFQGIPKKSTGLKAIGRFLSRSLELLQNAIKFSDGNDLEVSLNCKVIDQEVIETELTVSDQGIGLDMLLKIYLFHSPIIQ